MNYNKALGLFEDGVLEGGEMDDNKNIIIRSFHGNITRYAWDEGLDYNEWCQLDTRQDASYYGHWINPFRLTFIGFAEGDITEVLCASESGFRSYLRNFFSFQQEMGYDSWIDMMCNNEQEKLVIFDRIGMGGKTR